MKATLKIISLLALSTGLASAASTVLSAYYDTSFRTSTGTLLGSGFTARIGTTSAASFSTTDNYASILATWTAVSSTEVAFSSSAADNLGYFSGTFSYSTQPGVPIVLWVSDGANQNFVATIDQVFANDAAFPFNTNTYDITAATVGDLTIKLGSYQAGTDGFGGEGGNLILNNIAAIPEPSAALLGALGALGLLRRRRI